jgi:Pectate lyase superfamily protein
VSQPQPYSPQHAFVSDSAILANFPGQALDVEFNDVKQTTDAINANLKLIQRDDGVLANGTVGYDTLSPALQVAGIAPAFPWATATFYSAGTAVLQAGALYRCLVAHTSGVFATDIAAGNWLFITVLVAGGTPAVAAPLMDGTAAVGTSLLYARQDHAHPSDTSLAPLASPALTGNPTAPTPASGTNTTQIATTAFVLANTAPPTFLQAGTGAVTRTVQNKDREGISVKDFGAVGDGVTDDTIALTNCHNYANSLSAAPGSPASWHYPEVLYPPGDYLISSSLPAVQSMRGLGQARIVGSTTAFDLVTSASITRLDVSDLTFVSGKSAFSFGNNNIDDSLFNFTRCHFFSTGFYAINATLGTPGPYSAVLNCRDCNWIATNGAVVTATDVLNIDGGWGEPNYTNWTAGQAFFVAYHATSYTEQFVNITRFTGVPVLYTGSAYVKGRWVDLDSAGEFRSAHNRWGGEFAGIPIVYYSGGYESTSPFRGGKISITDSECYAGSSANTWSGAINLRGNMPMQIEWHGNKGPVAVPVVTNEGAGSGGVTVATYLAAWQSATGQALTNPYWVWNIDLAGTRCGAAAPYPAGTEIISGAWANWSPASITSGGGAPTTVSAAGRYRVFGKTVEWNVAVTVTTAGTATSAINLSLPIGTAKIATNGVCSEVVVSGNVGVARILSGASTMALWQYNNTTFWANGAVVIASGIYEMA